MLECKIHTEVHHNGFLVWTHQSTLSRPSLRHLVVLYQNFPGLLQLVWVVVHDSCSLETVIAAHLWCLRQAFQRQSEFYFCHIFPSTCQLRINLYDLPPCYSTSASLLLYSSRLLAILLLASLLLYSSASLLFYFPPLCYSTLLLLATLLLASLLLYFMPPCYSTSLVNLLLQPELCWCQATNEGPHGCVQYSLGCLHHSELNPHIKLSVAVFNPFSLTCSWCQATHEGPHGCVQYSLGCLHPS